MNNILDNLLRLKEIESDIERLNKKICEMEYMQNQSYYSDYNRLKGDLLRLEDMVSKIKNEIRIINSSIDKEENTISKFYQNLNYFKTNKEYGDGFKKVEGAKTNLKILKDRLASLSKQLVVNEDYLKLKRNELIIKKAEIKKSIESANNEIISLRNLLYSLMSTKESIIKEFNGKVLDKFQRVYARYGSKFISLLTDDTCNGCSVRIPKQTSIDIKKLVFEELVQCPNCGRFLYTNNCLTAFKNQKSEQEQFVVSHAGV